MINMFFILASTIIITLNVFILVFLSFLNEKKNLKHLLWPLLIRNIVLNALPPETFASYFLWCIFMG